MNRNRNNVTKDTLIIKILIAFLLLLTVVSVGIIVYMVCDTPTASNEDEEMVVELEPKEEIAKDVKTPKSTPTNQVDERLLNDLINVSVDYKYDNSIPEEDYIKYLLIMMEEAKISNGRKKVLAKEIVSASKKTSFDPVFIAVVIGEVSGFHELAVSPAGRLGLLQINPKVLPKFKDIVGDTPKKVQDLLLTPTYNLQTGLSILKKIYTDSDKKIEKMLRSFYWGDGTDVSVISSSSVMPLALNRFVAKTVNRYKSMSQYVRKRGNPRDPDGSLSQEQLKVIERVLSEEAEKSTSRYADLAVNLIISKAKNVKVSPLLVTSIVSVLTKFDPQFVSKDGKIGLMQIDPKQGEVIADLGKNTWNGATALKDVRYNLTLGISYLAYLKKDVFNNEDSYALAAYLWEIKGVQNVAKKKIKMPNQVLNQMKVIWREYDRLKKQAELYLNELYKINEPTDVMKELEGLTREVTKANGMAVSGDIIKEKIARAPISREKIRRMTFASEGERLKYIITRYGMNDVDASQIAQQIIMTSYKNKLDPLFLASIIAEESGFYWYAETGNEIRKYGLFQLTEDEGKVMAGKSRMSWGGVKSLVNSDYSLRLVGTYLTILKRIFSNRGSDVLVAFYSGTKVLKRTADVSNQKDIDPEVSEKKNSTIKRYLDWKKYYMVKSKK